MNQPNYGFASNRVSNTKYHWWSFLFVNLYSQLMFVSCTILISSQPMNAYYVVEACLEVIAVFLWHVVNSHHYHVSSVDHMGSNYFYLRSDGNSRSIRGHFAIQER